jgi:hypothetical protein
MKYFLEGLLVLLMSYAGVPIFKWLYKQQWLPKPLMWFIYIIIIIILVCIGVFIFMIIACFNKSKEE